LDELATLLPEVAERLARVLSKANVIKLGKLSDNLPKASEMLSEAALDCRQQEQRLVLQEVANRMQSAGDDVSARELRAAVLSVRPFVDLKTSEVVWTGPSAVATSFRGTEQALLEVIDASQFELLVVLYLAYDIAEIVDALERALLRGVAITVVVETVNPKTGQVKDNAVGAFSPKVRAGAKLHHWPLEVRELDENGRPGCLHAKVAVADRSVVLVTSANLTGSAMRHNMELGIRIQDQNLGTQIVEHFERLIDYAVLVGLP
jgi:phosphatidylserine/phosphatidylglycerophosphate/cardiolipin synthase-like enzyme